MIEYYNTLEEAYVDCRPKSMFLCKKYLSNFSNAEDVIQDVFANTLEFKNQNPLKNLSAFVIFKNVIKKCFQYNRNV